MRNVKDHAGKLLLATSIVLGGFLSGTVVGATPADPGGTGAGMTSLGDGIEEWVATYAVPVIVGVLLLGIGIRLMQRLSKRATNAV